MQLGRAITDGSRRQELAGGELCKGMDSDVQARGLAVMISLLFGLALSGCAGGLHSAGGAAAASSNAAAPAAAENAPAAAAPAGPQRELTPAEKKIIIEAVAPSLRDAGAAKYQDRKSVV